MLKRTVAIDSQKLSAMQSCAYQYNLDFNLGLEPLIKDNALERGELVHEMLKYYYRLRRHKDRWAQNSRTHSDIINTCINIGRHYARKMTIQLEEIEECVNAFKQYASFNETDDWFGDNIIEVERTGSKLLYTSEDLDILYEVKIDLIVKMQNMPMIAVDHKTSKQRKTPAFLSNQFFGYCWFLANNNILVNTVGFQKTLAPKEKFIRHTLSYPQSLIENWRCNTINTVREFVDRVDRGYYPQNFTSCDKFNGCKFKDICETEDSMKSYKMQSLYQIKKNAWDVGGQL